ncbi:hypothetical protein B296_00012784 [Ensete ventricosum]|uniref:Uncharacterized protein n=1 Tax=Ensete ventricosum TaxID=4639 RepID=A0A427AGI8_ENSVE|nr:hypothetical protein B296_00012784 [Ensete ventricosum]
MITPVIATQMRTGISVLSCDVGPTEQVSAGGLRRHAVERRWDKIDWSLKYVIAMKNRIFNVAFHFINILITSIRPSAVIN